MLEKRRTAELSITQRTHREEKKGTRKMDQSQGIRDFYCTLLAKGARSFEPGNV